ncbi:ABC transporter permease [Reichenbachiella sp.]|uniref:ABC transporter permease n=1 Tax=Reichenbachiella sp. TaxID=2184521 RepID=UPI003297C949
MLIHIKAGLRRFVKNRTISLISISGLTLGLSIVIILASYIHYQSSFDHFHSNSDRTYKVISKFYDPKGKLSSYGISFGTLADEYLANFEQVETATRYYRQVGELEVGLERFNQVQIGYSDYSFFDVFDFGYSQKRQFARPDQAILSKKFAKILFGDESAIGREVRFKDVTYLVSDVINVPLNSQFQFDIVIPLASMPDYRSLVHQSGLEFHTYVLLERNADHQQTLDLLANHYNESLDSRWQGYAGDSFLISLKELHMKSGDITNSLSAGNLQALKVIGVLGLFILILAAINYVNFQIAGAQSREKEIGLRKVVGASRNQLALQIVIESIVVVALAGGLALGLLEVIAQMIDPELIAPELFSLEHWTLSYFLLFGLLVVTTGFLAGIYPAIYLSRSITLHKSLSKTKHRMHPAILSLVVAQFLISSLLMVSIVIMHVQLQFMKDMPKGFDQERVLLVDNFDLVKNYDVIKYELGKLAGIEQICLAQAAPGGGTSGQFFKVKSAPDHEQITVNHVRVIDNYINTFDLKLVSGRDYDYDLQSDRKNFILNESAYKKIGSPDLGTQVYMGGRVGEIIGVMKDYNFESLHHGVSPLVLTFENLHGKVLALKLKEDNLKQTIGTIESVIQNYDPAYVIDYQFMDDQFTSTYKNELRAEKITTYAAFVTILLSVLGVLALSVFLINTRSKEVAIRKVVGASFTDLFLVLGSKIILWILFGSVVAIPLAGYAMSNWLSSFHYRIELWDHLLWIAPAVLTAIVTFSLLSIINKLIRACIINPVEFLKEE